MSKLVTTKFTYTQQKLALFILNPLMLKNMIAGGGLSLLVKKSRLEWISLSKAKKLPFLIYDEVK